MVSIIWALSALVIVMLIVYFAPIGLRKTGKVIVVLSGFLLALAGLAAANAFSLWLTLLILVVLIFFVSYILDSRIKAVLYEQGGLVKQPDAHVEPTAGDRAGRQEHREDEQSLAPLNLLKNTQNNRPGNGEAENHVIKTDGDDISFLLNRRLTLEEEAKKKKEEPKRDVDYLAEIEDLLGRDMTSSDAPVNPEDKDAGGQTGLEEIPVLPYHKKEEGE